MLEQRPGISKRGLAKSFGIARSTLYRTSKQAEKDKRSLAQILEIMREHPDYGQPRISMEMGRNIKLVRRIMLKYGLKTKKRKKRFRKPKDEGKAASQIPNRMKNLSPICPNAFWVGDFTHFAFYGTTVYLATVLDRYTREVVGWALGLHHSAQLVIDALEDAKRRRGIPHTFHTDQGSEYDSASCKAWLLAHRILPSHSEKASPWQNGHQESFFGRFKGEFGSAYRFRSMDELVEALHHQMHYYNTRRIQRAIRMAPVKKYEEAVQQGNLPTEFKKQSRPESVA